MVTVVTAAVVVALVAKLLVGAETVIGVLVEDLAIDLAINLAVDLAIDLAVDLAVGAWVGALPDLEVIVVAAALIELADVDVDILVVVAMTVLEFTVPTSSEGFRCWAAFDCRPMTALNCASVLHTCIPSYHV